MKAVKDFINEMSEKHDVPVDRIVVGIINNNLYVWDYSTGRRSGTEFKVLEIIEL